MDIVYSYQTQNMNEGNRWSSIQEFF